MANWPSIVAQVTGDWCLCVMEKVLRRQSAVAARQEGIGKPSQQQVYLGGLCCRRWGMVVEPEVGLCTNTSQQMSHFIL